MVTAIPEVGSEASGDPSMDDDKQKRRTEDDNDVGNQKYNETRKRGVESSITGDSTTTTINSNDKDAIPYHEQSPEVRMEAFEKDKLPSIIEIKRKLPKHCFEPVLSLSLYYVFRDLAILFVLYHTTDLSYYYLPSWLFWLGVTPSYWLVQGTVLFGIFVLGHDCGHGSFSRYQLFNDFMGTLLHTILLVPYYAWKLSHKNHHKNTGNFEKDEVFYPIDESTKKDRVLIPGFGLGLGWFIYLFEGYSPRRVFHFNPFETLFKKHIMAIYISIITILGWLMCLYYYYMQRGLCDIIYFYFVPIFVYASWLVICTFLHHNDSGIPWYKSEEWTYVRGQLSSVDRDYGWAHDLTHSIDTHQVHHLFPSMPHYYLDEATVCFRKAFPQLVRINNERIIPTFISTYLKFARDSYIKKDSLIHWYK